MNRNLFALPPGPAEEEIFTHLAGGSNILIERIVSAGQSSPDGFWYDQNQDEWVAVLQGSARLAWEDGTERALHPGDWLLIPAHTRHRVAWTSATPPCIWLAVHGKLVGDAFSSNTAE